jgi:hypothetical protein
MARFAAGRMARHSLARTFEGFWNEHLLAVEPQAETTPLAAPIAAVPSPA